MRLLRLTRRAGRIERPRRRRRPDPPRDDARRYPERGTERERPVRARLFVIICLVAATCAPDRRVRPRRTVCPTIRRRRRRRRRATVHVGSIDRRDVQLLAAVPGYRSAGTDRYRSASIGTDHRRRRR